MTSLMYGELELSICLHFPMVATRINKEGVSLWRPFQVAWRCFEEIFLDLKIKKKQRKKQKQKQNKQQKKQKELIKHIERSDVLVRCE